jgi:hypothetical protein
MDFLAMPDRTPHCAADPRPGNRPAFIPAACECGTPLVLADLRRDPSAPWHEVWHDEWECPRCEDGARFDAPEGCALTMALVARITPENSHPLVDWGPPVGAEVW